VGVTIVLGCHPRIGYLSITVFLLFVTKYIFSCFPAVSIELIVKIQCACNECIVMSAVTNEQMVIDSMLMGYLCRM